MKLDKKPFAGFLPLVLVCFLHAIVPGIVFGATQQDTLKQYIADLQKNPNNYALREKIINLVRVMKPAPAIPEEARRHYIMGSTMFKDAKKIEDFSQAAEEFKSALLIAPWWPEANRDLGMTLEAAQKYDEAINALKLYILTNPGTEKTRAAQDEIYNIEAKQKIAAKAKAEAEAATKAAEEAKLQSVEGTWEISDEPNYSMRIYKKDNGEWSVDVPDQGWGFYAFEVIVNGRSVSFTKTCKKCEAELNTWHYNLTLSSDGTKLVGTATKRDEDRYRVEAVEMLRVGGGKEQGK